MTVTTENIKKELQALFELLKIKHWDVVYENASEPRPYDCLLVKMYSDAEDKNIFWQAELSFLPGLEADLGNFNLMQCFVPMVVQVPAEYNDAMNRMVVRINTKLPLLGFGFLESHAIVYFKHNFLLPKGEPGVGASIVQETLSMVNYLLHTFQDSFADVALGNKTADEALNTMPFNQVFA